MIESGVIAEGSVVGVLEGLKYNRAVRCHKLLYEALLRLTWEGFLSWMQSKRNDFMEDSFDDYVQFTENICQETFTEMLSKPALQTTAESFWEYLDHLRISGGNLASFWMTYIDIVQIMLDLLRPSREGNWLLHLSAIHDMIPWCFSYDKQNYARYLSYYYAEMTNLQEEHPEIHAYLSDGGFSVQLGSQNLLIRQ